MKYYFYTTLLAFLLIACQSNNSTNTEEIIAHKDTTSSVSTASASSEQEETPTKFEEEELEEDDSSPIYRYEWTGTINGSIAIHGYYELANGYMDSGMDVWVGELIYDKIGKPIKIIGQLKNGGTSIWFSEMDEIGNITGILAGKWQSGRITEGSWYSPSTRKSFNLTMNAVAKNRDDYQEIRPKNTASIVGKYHYEYGTEGHLGTLDVHSVKDNQVSFDLSCLTAAPGRNIASLEEATNPISDYVINIDLYKDCEFNIRFFDGFAIIDYVLEKSDCEFGHNADVSGIFRKIE